MPLSGAGAMTLTLYSVHVWVMSLIPKNAVWPGDNEIYWVQVIVALSVGTTLKVLDMRGPFEFITSTASRATRDAIRGGHRQYS